jgi:tRNA threonylcarbamoyladenosine biosynthesis protein TsaB
LAGQTFDAGEAIVILAIDTTTEQAGIALMEEDRVRAERSWTAAGNHSKHLTSEIAGMLALEGVPPAALSAIVVAQGPGSFSGVRVGISEAKGIAMALGVPVVGIPTTEAIAAQVPERSGTCLVTIPAGRGQVYEGRYTLSPTRPDLDGPLAILDVDRAADAYRADDILAGPGAALLATVLAARGVQVREVTAPSRLRRAGYLAELGRQFLGRGGEDQLYTLEPIYLRRSAAEEARAAHPGA